MSPEPLIPIPAHINLDALHKEYRIEYDRYKAGQLTKEELKQKAREIFKEVVDAICMAGIQHGLAGATKLQCLMKTLEGKPESRLLHDFVNAAVDYFEAECNAEIEDMINRRQEAVCDDADDGIKQAADALNAYLTANSLGHLCVSIDDVPVFMQEISEKRRR